MPSLLPDAFALSWAGYALALAGAFCLGLSKTGFPGLSIVNVLIAAEVFGAKASVGIVLPLLVVADFLVYPLFRKFASWRMVWPLLPAAVAGVLIGWQLLGRISDGSARTAIGAVVLAMLALQLLRSRKPRLLTSLPDSLAFRHGSGLAVGISTTLANAAGPIYACYALVHRMSKEDFLGIGARFFLFLNLFKIPFNSQLGILNHDSLLTDAFLLPGLVAGILVGRILVARIPQKSFDALLTAFTTLAALRLIFF